MVLVAWWFAMVIGVIPFGLCEDDVFEKCFYHEVCIEEDGIPRTLECLSMLGKLDTEVFLEIASKYFPVDDITTLLNAGCKDDVKAKEAINYYFEERMRRDQEAAHKSGQPMDEKRKRVECRGCLMGMIEECRTKRVMGFNID